MQLDDILTVLDLHITSDKLCTTYGDIVADLYEKNEKFILRFGETVNQKSELIKLPTGGIRIVPITT